MNDAAAPTHERPLRALITNDDGVEGAGLPVLAERAVAAGFDVTVAAPSWDSSGASASFTAVESHGAVVVDSRTIDGLEGVPVLAVEAAPAYIVRAAVAGAFGPPPEVVLSGINLGANTGRAVLHSGTVGAALTANALGIPALAVSLGTMPTGDVIWDGAAYIVDCVLPLLRTSASLVLNVNVPSVPPEEVRGLMHASLAPSGVVQVTNTELDGGLLRLTFDGESGHAPPGSDAGLLDAGWATITALVAPCEDPRVDLGPLLDETLADNVRRIGLS